jgi:hypothetical protein
MRNGGQNRRRKSTPLRMVKIKKATGASKAVKKSVTWRFLVGVYKWLNHFNK